MGNAQLAIQWPGTNIHETKVTVSVPYHMPGNVIEHLPITFRILHTKSRYRAEPEYTDAEKRLVALPTSFTFEVIGEKIIMKRMDLVNVAGDILKKISK